MRATKARIACVVLALSTGCIGIVEDAGAGPRDELPGEGPVDGEPGPGGGEPGEGPPPTTCADEVGPRMVRRLTAHQYQLSLEAVFGTSEVPQADVLADPVVHGFRVDASQAVIRDLGAQQIMNHAERVAEWAVTTRLDAVAPCRTRDAACRDRFVGELGMRMFREPLSDAQRTAYGSLFDAEGTFEDAAEVVIAAMLQSPYFLYRREIGAPSGARHRLSAYELASELSYLVTDAPPDAALMDAAASGRLETPDDLARELARLVATDAATESLSHFAFGWLEIEDLPQRAKDDAVLRLGDEVRASMLAETRMLFFEVLRGGGSLRDLIAAPHTYLDQPLRMHYGLWEGYDGSAGMARVTIPPGTRAPGILGHGSVLTRHALASTSSPVARGLLVRERFLCEDLPAPPPGVATDTVTMPGATTTTRERYLEHSTNPTCAACHRLMDPIGFAFEHYDAFGRRREQDAGRAVDVSGMIHGAPGGDVPLDGLESLVEHLAGSAQVRSCFARYLSYYAYGIEGCEGGAPAAEDQPIADVLASLVRATHFRERAD